MEIVLRYGREYIYFKMTLSGTSPKEGSYINVYLHELLLSALAVAMFVTLFEKWVKQYTFKRLKRVCLRE